LARDLFIQGLVTLMEMKPKVASLAAKALPVFRSSVEVIVVCCMDWLLRRVLDKFVQCPTALAFQTPPVGVYFLALGSSPFIQELVTLKETALLVESPVVTDRKDRRSDVQLSVVCCIWTAVITQAQ
jgi:hypothetical protein